MPQTKQIGYYSDAYKLEFVLPKFAMYKRILAKILAERFVIDRGWSETRGRRSRPARAAGQRRADLQHGLTRANFAAAIHSTPMRQTQESGLRGFSRRLFRVYDR